MDIAGPAWLNAASAYRPKGGSGYGVRLLYQFLKNYA
jgi:leucyl aminopeptidase